MLPESFGVETISETTLLPNLAERLEELSCLVGVKSFGVFVIDLESIISKPE